jgi:mRNA interferase HigB
MAVTMLSALALMFPIWEHQLVRIVGRERLNEFARKHPDSRPGLDRWTAAVNDADWKTPANVRETFATASFVRNKTVFDIGGGKYRLIALISYLVRIVSVEQVLTHKEYDKGSWKKK